MKAPRRTQAEIVATHFGSDIVDMRDMKYQPTRYASPSIFTVYAANSDYWLAQPTGRKIGGRAGAEFNWTPAGEYYGWTVYFGTDKDATP
jgi:hypothetical protein